MAMRGKKKEAERKKRGDQKKNGTEAKEKLRFLQTKFQPKPMQGLLQVETKQSKCENENENEEQQLLPL